MFFAYIIFHNLHSLIMLEDRFRALGKAGNVLFEGQQGDKSLLLAAVQSFAWNYTTARVTKKSPCSMFYKK